MFTVTRQHDFTKGKFTITKLIYFTQYVTKAIDKKLQTDVVYTDFSKAFDQLNRAILPHCISYHITLNKSGLRFLVPKQSYYTFYHLYRWKTHVDILIVL